MERILRKKRMIEIIRFWILQLEDDYSHIPSSCFNYCDCSSECYTYPVFQGENSGVLFLDLYKFQRPEEYGNFRFDLDNGSKSWESYIYMNRSANIREEDIYKLIKPFFEGESFFHLKLEKDRRNING